MHSFNWVDLLTHTLTAIVYYFLGLTSKGNDRTPGGRLVTMLGSQRKRKEVHPIGLSE
jgi:hypothetical protein